MDYVHAEAAERGCPPDHRPASERPRREGSLIAEPAYRPGLPPLQVSPAAAEPMTHPAAKCEMQGFPFFDTDISLAGRCEAGRTCRASPLRLDPDSGIRQLAGPHG